MLVLMRKPQEKVFLTLEDGRVITVILVAVERNRARLGFEAPKTIRIDRDDSRDVSDTGLSPA